MSILDMYETLTNLISEEAVDLVGTINGWSEETMTDILFAVTGYRSFDQLLDEE